MFTDVQETAIISMVYVGTWLPLSKVGYAMLGDSSLDVWQEKTYLVMWTKYRGQTQAGEEMKCSLALVCAVLGIVCTVLKKRRQF